MQKLFRMTPLEDSFPCNFNILISGMPRVMGVREILGEWAAFRTECVRRRTYYDLQGKEKRLHLLKGLEAILLDIDKAVRIVRETEEEAEVVPNLMIGFGIDKVQAEYVAEIKLRHLNREYILRRTQETTDLEADIARLKDILNSPAKIKRVIIDELAAVAKQYGEPRRSEILYEAELPEDEDEDDFEEFEAAPRAAVPERRDRSERMDRTGSLYSAPVEPERRSNKVVNIHTTTQLQVVLVKPERFENASEIADHLREKRTVVLNLESTNKDIARRLIDFLSGVAYAGEGKIKKVAANTYIITPYHVDIMGDLIDELENNGLYL